MVFSSVFIPSLALLCFLRPIFSLKFEERAIIPTTTGQIGINPVTSDLGPPSKWIGVNTEYLTELVDNGQTTTKWIGVNTEYLTQDVAPVMDPNTPTKTLSVITTSVGAIASTATATGEGLNVGDVSVTFSPALVDKLKALAVEVCGSPTKRRLSKRQGSCEYTFANRVASSGGPMEFDIDLPTISAADVAYVLSAIGKTAVPTSGATGVALLMWYIWSETGDMPNTINIPKQDIGSSSPSNPAGSTTNSPCPTGSDTPVCQNSQLCNSPNNATCTTSVKYETCSCANYLNIEFHPATPQNLLAAQSNLASMSSIVIAAATTTMAPPDCMADGAPWFLPTSWCDCGSAKYPTLPPATNGASASSTGANCAYTILPTATLSIVSNTASPAPTNVPGQNGVAGCAYYIAANQGLPSGTPNYCFCGGGPDVSAVTAPLLTHTDVNPPKTDCNYATQPTSNWTPQAPQPTTTIPPSPSPPTPSCANSGLYNMRQASAASAASVYCAAKATEAANGAVIGNQWPGACSQQNLNAVYQPPAQGQVEAGMSDIMFTAGPDGANDYCKNVDVSTLKFSQDDCNLALSIAINGCDTNTVDTKHGGRVSVNCMMFGLWPEPFGSSYPCFGQFCTYGWLSNCKPPS